MFKDYKQQIGPCPVCGGPSDIDSAAMYYDGDVDITIKCLKCGLELSHSSSCCHYPRTSITWRYDINEKTLPYDIWNGVNYKNEM